MDRLLGQQHLCIFGRMGGAQAQDSTNRWGEIMRIAGWLVDGFVHVCLFVNEDPGVGRLSNGMLSLDGQ